MLWDNPATQFYDRIKRYFLIWHKITLYPCKNIYEEKENLHDLITKRAICKSRNRESGNGMKETMEMRRIRVRMIGMRGIRVRLIGMQGIRVGIIGIRVGMQGIRLRMWGIRMEILGIRVEMRGMQETRVGMRGTGSGNTSGIEELWFWRGTRNKKLCVSRLV